MSVRISVESLSGCAWNGCPSQRGIRNTQAEWRQLHIVKEGALEKSRSGYIVAIHPYAVPEKRQSEKAVTFDLVVDQFIPEIGATQLATSGTGAAVNGGESTIFWTAAGKKYTLETRLVSLD